MEEFVFLAGVNYPVYHAEPGRRKFKMRQYGPFDWRNFSVRRAKKISGTRKRLDLKFTLFDAFKGTRETISFDKQGKASFDIASVALGPIVREDYRRVDQPSADVNTAQLRLPEAELTFSTPPTTPPQIGYFAGVSKLSAGDVSFPAYKAAYYGGGRSPPARALGIADVYDYIIAQGASQPRSIVELHIFSHGILLGPVIANSRDLIGIDKKPGRDPLDKDGRLRDFDPGGPILPNAELFASAFAANARSFIWGCDALTWVRNMLNQMLQQAKYVANRDDKSLQFRWSKDWNISREFFHTRLRGVPSSDLSDFVSISDVATFVRDHLMDETYHQRLANASRKPVLGALPATYSNPDEGGPEVDRLLHIPMSLKGDLEIDFRAILNFYLTYVDAKFDPKEGFSPKYGRGYNIYEPKTPKTASADNGSNLIESPA